MNRFQAINHLNDEFSDLQAETGLDISTGYDSVIDNALRELGYAETDLATADVTTDIKSYIALLDYFALKRFARKLAIYEDVRVDNVGVNQSQIFGNVTKLLAQAENRVKELGYLSNEVAWGYVSMGFREF